MKICYDLRGFNVSLQKTGIGWCVFELVRQMAKQSTHQVQGFNNVTNPSILEIKNLFNLKLAGVPIKRSLLPDKIYQLLWQAGLKSFRQYDVFHSPWQNFYLPVTDHRTLNIYSIYDLTTITHKELHHQHNQATEVIIRENVKRCTNIVTDSHNTKQDIQRVLNFPAENIKVIYPPLRNVFKSKNIKPRLTLNYPFLLFVGTLEPRKNITSIIKAFNIVKARKDYQPFKLILAGKKGWKSAGIFKEIENSDYSKDIIWMKYLSDDDLAYLYRKATAFIFPSLYEGFGMPVMEALVSQCPVITANNSSLSEIAQGCSVLLGDPLDFKLMAQKIEEVISSKELRQRLIRQGLERAQQLEGNYAEQHLNYYQQLLHDN